MSLLMALAMALLLAIPMTSLSSIQYPLAIQIVAFLLVVPIRLILKTLREMTTEPVAFLSI